MVLSDIHHPLFYFSVGAVIGAFVVAHQNLVKIRHIILALARLVLQ